jgi:antitoxin component HigA of HigAB toxin-antitoxin module
MITNPTLLKSIQQLPPEVVLHTDWAFAISDKIAAILERKGLTQKDLAHGLGKSESEVSKWLGGTQNFTLKTIALISSYLGEPLIVVND